MFDSIPGLSNNLLLALSLLLLLRSLPNRSNVLRSLFSGLAVLLNFRYFSWRLHATMDSPFSSVESIWQWVFFLAELIAILSLSWHLIVLAWRPRSPNEFKSPLNKGTQPTVDVFIATYNENEAMLERTIQAATQIDYPELRIHVLDDGNRDWLKTLSQRHGAVYIARTERTHFKAGNLNHALKTATGDYLLCIDADFAVKPNIIKEVLGYFEDRQVAIVQTPQHFHNPDAIQHNLLGQTAWPEEQRIFTDVMQPCRDNWGNAFCYGTNFVIRREYLNAIGGFPVDSICEDIYLSYTLKKEGWITRFHNKSLAEGQAADTLTEFVNQRTRWCAGTLQCLFLKNGPIRSPQLRLIDRIFFLDPVFYYLSSIWFFFMLIAPAIFWWTGKAPFDADNGHLLMMLAPRVLVSSIVLYWLTDRKVLPIISEIGRYVSLFFILRTTISTICRPTKPAFRVTNKNNSREATTINWKFAVPHMIILSVTLLGILRTLVFGAANDEGLNQNIGLILALTTFSFWVSFLALLTCIEPVLQTDRSATRSLARQGSFRQSFASLVKKVIQ